MNTTILLIIAFSFQACLNHSLLFKRNFLAAEETHKEIEGKRLVQEEIIKYFKGGLTYGLEEISKMAKIEVKSQKPSTWKKIESEFAELEKKVGSKYANKFTRLYHKQSKYIERFCQAHGTKSLSLLKSKVLSKRLDKKDPLYYILEKMERIYTKTFVEALSIVERATGETGEDSGISNEEGSKHLAEEIVERFEKDLDKNGITTKRILYALCE